MSTGVVLAYTTLRAFAIKRTPFFIFAKNTHLLMGTYYFMTKKEENGMINVEGLMKYLEETGLGDRIVNLKPGDSFGVELPIDEENNKWLRFWLSVEGSEDKIEFATLDFEGLVRIRICCDDKKLEDWLNNSGIMELSQLSMAIHESTEKAEVKE